MSKVTMPSPEFPGVIVKGHKAIPRYLFTAGQMEAYAAAKVREALEEAAKVCDARANQNELATSDVEPDEVSSLRSAAWQMGVCARAIRALIPSTPA